MIQYNASTKHLPSVCTLSYFCSEVGELCSSREPSHVNNVGCRCRSSGVGFLSQKLLTNAVQYQNAVTVTNSVSYEYMSAER